MSNENGKYPKKRRLRKVYYGYYEGRGFMKKGSRYPVIRIGGKYLLLWSFNIGDVIEVEFQHGQIKLTKCSPDCH